MATHFHPHLFDADRFERERDAAPDNEAVIDLIGGCMIDDDAFGWALDESDLATDFISARVDRHGCNMGSIVDNVLAGCAGVANLETAIRLLGAITERHGRLVALTPLVGYLTRGEIDQIVAQLEPATLADAWQERDRKVLIAMLRRATARNAGMLYSQG